jgi:DnaJ family protein C protein 28
MDKFESVVDKLIRESMERGEFDDLAGKGEPVDLSENPFEDPDVRTAHRLLRNAGFAPAWVEERKDIEARLLQARTTLLRARELYRDEIPTGARWQRAVQEFRETVAELNQRIRMYNLKAPGTLFHRKVFDGDAWISQLEREANDD